MDLRRKRAYDTAEPGDGFRVLVDRLWPRGVSKDRAAIDLWAKEVAPSPELRKAWHAAETDADFDECAARYRSELSGDDAEALDELVAAIRGKDVVTLVYALHDEEHTHAIVLEEVLRDRV
ncbi:DUF488 family protein [Microbacterium pseudoresistens]|uniref:Uncharacterized protein YeaO (DUF488 family) n=1 Tax=Microbacterium pseudoresistens TaxID=640634 RepID=A0A7Y9EUT5_9MICO|nr:DUF488 family protein [Microbacterium pseudoresistens]NYD54358.1 uncharacterized protein YeaO (DUF488 family) [Microbacterium pseudoresistens]